MGDKVPLLLNILTSVLCQFKDCVIIWRQAVATSYDSELHVNRTWWAILEYLVAF